MRVCCNSQAALESARYIDTELDDMLNFGLDEVLDFCAPELDDNWMTSALHTGVGVQAPLSPGDASLGGDEEVDLEAPVVFGDHKRPHHSPVHHRSEAAEDKAAAIVEEASSVASGSEFTEPLASKKVHRSLHKEALMAEWGFTVANRTAACSFLHLSLAFLVCLVNGRTQRWHPRC